MVDWQQIVSLGIVFATGVLLVRSEIRRRLRARLRLCGHDCGCAPEVERIKKAIQNEQSGGSTRRV